MKPIPFEFSLRAKDETFMVLEDILPYGYNEFHYHKETQLTLIVKGSGSLFLENNKYPFKSGELYMIGGNQPHVFRSDPEYFKHAQAGRTHFIHIVFDYQRVLSTLLGLPELREVADFMKGSQSGLQLQGPLAAMIAGKMRSIKEATRVDRFIQLVHLWSFIAENGDAWKPLLPGVYPIRLLDTSEARLKDIYQYTLENFYGEISLKEIACVAALSVPAFCKYFKKHTRKTYFSVLNEIRINEARKRLLHNYYDSISSIAYDTGFNNLNTFNRVFKKITGKTPTAYKEQCVRSALTTVLSN